MGETRAKNGSPVYCVIGAGPAGLTATKNLKQAGFQVECLEARADIGGVWNLEAGQTAAYPSVSMISSKRLSAYLDHPLPKGSPPFPSRGEALSYLRSYADRFNLRDHIQLDSRVERAEPLQRGWQVRVAGETQPRRYDGLIVANGHHWQPLWPEWEGSFSERLMHAFEYQTPEDFRGQRVLVVGAGNSGCDICSEICRHAQTTMLSLRRGYHFLPKFLLGAPIDRCGEWLTQFRLPRFAYRSVANLFLRIAVGSPERYGLPKPSHRLFEAHPIINSRLLDDLGHGRITVKPDVAALQGSEVAFADGSVEPVDAIVCATGYRASFPFFEQDEAPDLFLHIFDRTRDDLFFVGLIQPNGAIWSLADYQSQLIAKLLTRQQQGATAARRFSKRKQHAPTRQRLAYLPTERHRFEVEFFDYRRELQKELQRL